MTKTRCNSPIEAAVLGDYWLEELAIPEGEAVEEHLIGCGDCSRRLQELVELIEAIRALTRKGLVHVVVNEPFVEKLRHDGLNLSQYRVGPGGSVACTITDKDDLVIARLAADMTGAERIDIAQCDSEGHEQMRMCDVPFIGEDSEVIFSNSTDYLRSLDKSVIRLRLLAIEDDRERILGEYTFNHTPSVG